MVHEFHCESDLNFDCSSTYHSDSNSDHQINRQLDYQLNQQSDNYDFKCGNLSNPQSSVTIYAQGDSGKQEKQILKAHKYVYLDIDYKKDDIRDANDIEKINPTDLL